MASGPPWGRDRFSVAASDDAAWPDRRLGRGASMPRRRTIHVMAARVKVLPATVDRWSDVTGVLDGSGEAGCWCQPWRGLDAKALSGGRSRPELLREQMKGGPPAPGYLAYLDGLAVGWVGVGVRSETPRLVHSRTIPALDDLPVWSIGCFQVRPGYRRRGVARALLEGVVEAAREVGAPGVEAYPIDPEGVRVEVGAG